MSASSSQNIVVPWINRDEFVKIFDELFSNNVVHIQHAIDRIKAWKSRSNKLPVAIDSTVELKTVQILYQKALEDRVVFENEEKIRREYSLAIVRFINHATESGQKAEFARPIITIAKQFGIPEWVVHIRHEVTHNALPPLDVLLTGVETALDWLKVTFWEKQLNLEDRVPTKSKKPEVDVKSILRSYVDQRLENLQCGYSSKEFKNLPKKLKSILADDSVRQDIVMSLCNEGCLIFHPHQLKALDIPFEVLNSSSISLPIQLVLFWKPVLKFIRKQGYGLQLVKQLICNLTDDNSLNNRQIAGWLYHLTFHWENKDDSGINMSFVNTSEYESVLQQILTTASIYNDQLLLHFCEQYQLKTQRKEKILKLINIYNQQNELDLTTCTSTTDNTIHNVQDILEVNRKALGKWQYNYSNIDWSTVPLGCMPGQMLGNDDLELVMPTSHVDNTRQMIDSDTTDTTSHLDNLTYLSHQSEEVNIPSNTLLSSQQLVYIQNKVQQFLQ